MSATISPTQTKPKPFRRPIFWATIALYILLSISLYLFLGLPLIRDIVEQNQNGPFKSYFDNKAGYGVLDSAFRDIRNQSFLVVQATALFVSLLMLAFRKHREIALGILAVIVTAFVLAFCAILIFALGIRLQGRGGY